ncbi:MAG TPA: hypothetical protein VM285_03730 [Polyangia bacterium]|nr:hypothetical protein [Polyangia bacterium]
MSRFADLNATDTVDLGECLCPGAPHESDWARVRTQLSAQEITSLAGADTIDSEGIAGALAAFIPEWNLLGPNGEPWPPSADSLVALMPPTLQALVAAISRAVEESSVLPNRSGARSVASSRASASTRRRTPGKRGT